MQKCRKEDLVQWASLALKRALTSKNILSGFKSTRIWPLNPLAMIERIGPSESFSHDNDEEQERATILDEDFPEAADGACQYYGTEVDIDADQERDNLQETESPPPMLVGS